MRVCENGVYRDATPEEIEEFEKMHQLPDNSPDWIKGGMYMANIKIGDTVIENVALTVSPNLLGMNFTTSMSLEELAVLFDADTAPEVRVLGLNGETTALYKNHRLTTLQMETVSGMRRVSAALQVTPLDVGGEAPVDVAALQAEVAELKAALAAIEEGIADA